MPVLQRVSADDGLEIVRGALGDRPTDAKVNFGHVDITVSTSDLVDALAILKDHEALRCRFFDFLSAVDRTEFGGVDKEEKHGGLEVLIHVYSPEHALGITLHVPVDLEKPVCPTITSLYYGAFWHERETHEMFGIDFDGHPRLVNLYLPEDFDGNPGLRSFKLPSRFVKDWPGAKDPEEAAAGGR